MVLRIATLNLEQDHKRWHGKAGEIHATRGPGEADYVQQLKNYDEAFGKFFDRLAAHESVLF